MSTNPGDGTCGCTEALNETCGNQPEESQDQAVTRRMRGIRHKILVLSGKGGVGKSTVAVNLAIALAHEGMRVGLLDVDFHGPSVPTMLGLQHAHAEVVDGVLHPVVIGTLKVMSIPFLLEEKDAAIIWRGPMKIGVIKELLGKVEWGELDYLIIDSPPGTGDEPLSICQIIDRADGAVIVTTPQEVALADVRRSMAFCTQLSLPVLGVIENMSGFVCPKCGEVVDIFKSGGGQAMAETLGARFLGRIPLDPQIVQAGDDGRAYLAHYRESETAKVFAAAIAPLMALTER